MIFLDLSEGMENCNMSEKNQGKVRDLEVDDKWQPCFITLKYFFGYNIRIFPF